MTIEAKHISVGYGQSIIIDDTSMHIEEGKINVIIGKNGSGKTTLFKALCKQLDPKAGIVCLNEIDIRGIKQTELAKQIGILFQENFTPGGLTVRELVSYGRYAYTGMLNPMTKADWEAVDKALEVTGMLSFSSRDVSELSSGQRQMVWIAMLVAQEARYLFLDEPTTYLDLKNQFEVLECLKMLKEKLGKTIVMILHDLNLAFQYADYVIMMKDWKLIQSGKTEDMINETLLSDAFDVNIKVVKADGRAYCIPANK